MKCASAKRVAPCLLVAGLLAWSAAACGQDAPASGLAQSLGASSPLPWQAVGDVQLDAMRGGFSLGNGLLASFGIERVVYIDGNLVASFSVHIPDVAHMTAAQAGALAAVTRSGGVIQNGPGNLIAPGAFNQASTALVIQNSLDHQDIKSLTTINASVNDLRQLSSSRLAESLQSALVGSLGH